MSKTQARPDQQYDYAEGRVDEWHEHAELLSRHVWRALRGHGHFCRPLLLLTTDLSRLRPVPQPTRHYLRAPEGDGLRPRPLDLLMRQGDESKQPVSS